VVFLPRGSHSVLDRPGVVLGRFILYRKRFGRDEGRRLAERQ